MINSIVSSQARLIRGVETTKSLCNLARRRPTQQYSLQSRPFTSSLRWRDAKTEKPGTDPAQSPTAPKPQNRSVYIDCYGVGYYWANQISRRVHTHLIEIVSKRDSPWVSEEQEQYLRGMDRSDRRDPRPDDPFDRPRLYFKPGKRVNKVEFPSQVRLRTGIRGWSDSEQNELEDAVRGIVGVKKYETKRMVGTGFRQKKSQKKKRKGAPEGTEESTEQSPAATTKPKRKRHIRVKNYPYDGPITEVNLNGVLEDLKTGELSRSELPPFVRSLIFRLENYDNPALWADYVPRGLRK